MKKPFLFTPGPTPLPERVLKALSQAIPYHRSSDFKPLFERIRGKLKDLFQTKNDVLILTSSGTGAMEAALTSLLKPRDPVLVVKGGKFGERFQKMAEAFHLKVDLVEVPWGEAVSVEMVQKALKQEHRALFIQASETSTGTQHPIEEISKVLKSFPHCLIIVDGITAIGASDIKTDLWKIDVMIAGSQKALMLPPGLSFLSLSEKAVQRLNENHIPSFYFDLKRELNEQRKNQTAFTPNISLIVALEESLNMLLEEGLPQVYERHEKLALATREALKTLGLKLASSSPGVACTAAFLPEGLDGKDFLKSIRERYGFTIAGGQDEWEGRVIRVSHLGYYSPFDLLNAISAIGRELERRSANVKTEMALKEFMDSYQL